MSKHKHIRFDWAMKRLLRQKANFVILEGFLSELLFEKITIKEILESEGNKEDQNDKFNKVDILVKDSKGELILIEVQNEKQDDYFHRINYGQAKLLTEHIFESDKYSKIKKIYSISIVYFELGHGKDYIYVGNTVFKGMYEEDILQLSEKQKSLYSKENISDIYTTYYLIKVNKFDEVAKNTLDEWIYFLKTSEIKDGFKAQGLPEAKEKLRVDNLPEAERIAYKNYIKTERIRESEIETALSDGFFKAEKKYTPIIIKERKEKEKEQKIRILKEQELKQEQKIREQKEQELEQKDKLIKELMDKLNK